MADVISLSEAKAHLRVTSNAEDTLIQLYVDAALDYIKNFLNKSNVPAKPAIKAAALLLVGGMYENRESVMETSIKENPAVMNLLYPYRECIGI